ncbi:hypothetical protein [Cellulomonas sp. ICMP 17802]|uniref:hypothetical protein n=1 Tax=Cellulomonas sp. ICMP 17802 TaxID=3239199 RepID=UPI00351AE088
MTTAGERSTGQTAEPPTSRTATLLWGSLVWGATAWSAVRHRVAGRDPERGDVPGWVLVTLMTAGLVTALWIVAGDALARVFENAIDSVTAP